MKKKRRKKDLAQQVLDKVKASDDVANADMDALAKEVDDSLSATAPAFTTAGDTMIPWMKQCRVRLWN